MMRAIISWREGQWHDAGDSFTQPDENLVLRTNRHIPCRALRTVWQQNQDKKHGTFIAPLATPEATPCMTRESGNFRGPQEVLTPLQALVPHGVVLKPHHNSHPREALFSLRLDIPSHAIQPTLRALNHLHTHISTRQNMPLSYDTMRPPASHSGCFIHTREGDILNTHTHPFASRDSVLDGLGGRGGVDKLVGRVLDEVDAC